MEKGFYNKNDKLFIIGIITIVVITLVAGSYGFIKITQMGSSTQTSMAGTFNIEYSDGDTINLENIKPISDEEGMKNSAYNFKITNTGNIDASYILKLEDDNQTDFKDQLIPSQIKYSLKENDDTWTAPALLSSLPNLILKENSKLKAGESISYSIKLWVDENVGNEGQNKTFAAKIAIEAIQDNFQNKKINDNPSSIILNGDTVEYIEKGNNYIDKGIKEIKDDKDKISNKDFQNLYEFYDGETLENTTNIDTSKIGVYYIKYTVMDSGYNESSIVRTVNVYDQNHPTIELNGDSVVYVNQGADYIDEQATATSSTGEDLTSKIKVEGVVDTNVLGTYEIKYLVEDNEGNTASVVRTVIVKEKKVVTVTLRETNGVSVIGSNDTLTCEIDKDMTSCEVVLPNLSSDKGKGYFTTDTASTAGVLPKTKIAVTDDVVYYTKAGEMTSPTCTVDDISSTTIASTGKASINISCDSADQKLIRTMTKDDLEVLVGKVPSSVESIELNPSQNSDNKTLYTLKLNGFKTGGQLTIKIKEGAIVNENQEANASLELPTGITIEKKISAKLEKGIGVENIDSNEKTCNIIGNKNTCEITLPKIYPKQEYYNSFWNEDENATSGYQEQEKIQLKHNTTFYANALDQETPQCSLNSATQKVINSTSKVTVSINCTDESQRFSKYLTPDDITPLVSGTKEDATIKLIKTTTLEKGKRYTFDLNNFENTGILSLRINKGSVKDISNNPNDQSLLTTGININRQTPSALAINDDIKYNESTLNQQQTMYPIKQPDNTISYRYIGKNPNNYLKFNNEMWRIIGIFDQKIKIVREESLNNYSWSDKESNNWISSSTLRQELNSKTYYETLSKKVQEKIANTSWNIGGAALDISTPAWYSKEKETTWQGNIGLISVSDYGYTYANGVNETCFENPMNDQCNKENASTSWLFNDSSYWLLTPYTNSANLALYVSENGPIKYDRTNKIYKVYPALYLKEDVLIKSGKGTKDNPYIV